MPRSHLERDNVNGTGRNMSMMHHSLTFTLQYADSHVIPAFAIVCATVLLTELSNWWTVCFFLAGIWVAVSLWIFSTWFFHPQTLKRRPAYNFARGYLVGCSKAGDVSRWSKTARGGRGKANEYSVAFMPPESGVFTPQSSSCAHHIDRLKYSCASYRDDDHAYRSSRVLS